MTNDELDRLAALCQAAPERYVDVFSNVSINWGVFNKPGTDFYLAARTALPDLLTEVRAVIQGEADTCQAKIADLMKQSRARGVDADTRTYHEALCFHYSQVRMRLLALLNEPPTK